MPDGMPTWEEWNEQLTAEQRQYSIYKVLASLDSRVAQTCDRVADLEKGKWKNRGVAGIGGVIGGFVAVISTRLFKP